ncbi:hypothetical protein D3C76_1278420 [compost metagenome]
MDLIAPTVLGRIQRLVGFVEPVCGVGHCTAARCQADTQTDSQLRQLLIAVVAHCPSQSLHNFAGLAQWAVGQDHTELVSTKATG